MLLLLSPNSSSPFTSRSPSLPPHSHPHLHSEQPILAPLSPLEVINLCVHLLQAFRGYKCNFTLYWSCYRCNNNSKILVEVFQALSRLCLLCHAFLRFYAESWCPEGSLASPICFFIIRSSHLSRLQQVIKNCEHVLRPNLQELAAQSKHLKIYLEERKTVLTILKNIEKWEMEAGSLLQSLECLFNMNDFVPALAAAVLYKIEGLLKSADAVIRHGLSLSLEFPEMPKLQNARYMLQWCHEVLSLSSKCPSVQVIKIPSWPFNHFVL